MDNKKEIISNPIEIVEFWVKTAAEDFSAMEDLVKTKHNNWALFLGHIVIEKLLKAVYVKVNVSYPPLIHNLLRLAEKSKIELETEMIEILSTITTFNIEARYDSYKKEFDKLCTDEFTSKWFEIIKETREWILTKYLQ